MDTLKSRGIAILEFIGLSLLIDLALLAAVGLSCLIGPQCTGLMWSERMFWLGMVPMMIGLGGIISWLGSGERPITYKSSDAKKDDEDEKQEAEVPQGARPHEFNGDPDEDSDGLSGRAKFALRMLSIGAGAYAISALLDVLIR
jgi:hypothetical protein